MKKNQNNKRLSAIVALNFLENHPGINKAHYSLMDNINWWFSTKCKNGHWHDILHPVEDAEVTFFRSDPEFATYEKEYWDEEDSMNVESLAEFDAIDVPYKVVYGYDWQLDKITYSADYVFYRFLEESLKRLICIKDFSSEATEDERAWHWKVGESVHGEKNFNTLPSTHFVKLEETFSHHTDGIWAGYEGGRVDDCETWEDLLIALAKNVKERYGDVGYDSYTTPEEIANNKKLDAFSLIPIKGSTNATFEMNEEYIFITDEEKNLRWYEWFCTTEHYKKNWE